MNIKGEVKYNFIKYLVLLLLLIYVFYPIFLVIISSFKTNPQVLRNVFSLPTKIEFKNYARAWFEGSLYMYYGNSLIISTVSILLVTLFSSFVAFAISREDFVLRHIIYIVFIIGIGVPYQVGIIPEYLLMSKLNLIDTRIGLVLVYIAYFLPFAVFIMTNYFKNIPKEIQESAIIDGCGNFRMYFSIIMPLSRSVITSVIIFSTVWIWNDMFFPLVLLQSKQLKTLPIGLLGFRGQYATNFSTMFAGVVLVSIPIVVAYLFLQREFIAGMTAGAVKG